MSGAPRVVVVHRPTTYEELIAQHGTRRQVEFFLERRGHDLALLDALHRRQHDALAVVTGAVPVDWRRSRVDRRDLDRWLFEPEDIVIPVGQDGLVANVAKYVDTQPVIGVDPDPDRNPGVLVRNRPDAVPGLLRAIATAGPESLAVGHLAMVEAVTDDDRCLRALNEVYVGHPSHQSSRYVVRLPDGRQEQQSSSGVIIGTGTGSTGWSASVWAQRRPDWPLPGPDESDLAWFVREAWPSPLTGTTLTDGRLLAGDELLITAGSDDLVVFGDGIETDRLSLRWGQRCRIRVSDRRLHLVG